MVAAPKVASSSIGSFEGEMPGFPRGRWEDGHFYGVRCVVVGWNDRAALLSELATESLGCWPYADGPSWAIARKVEIDPLDGAQINAAGSQLAEYEKAKVTIYYSTKGPKWTNNQLYEERIDPVAEYHTVDCSNLYWDATATKKLESGEAFGRLFYSFDWVQMYHRIEAVPAYLEARVGFINSNVVNAPQLGISFAPETLLYKPPSMYHTVTLTGTNAWDVSVRYGFCPAGWNKVWRAGHGYSTVYNEDGSVYRNFLSMAF